MVWMYKEIEFHHNTFSNKSICSSIGKTFYRRQLFHSVGPHLLLCLENENSSQIYVLSS